MNFKDFYYRISFNPNETQIKSYTAKQGDSRSRGFFINETTENKTIELVAKRPDNKKITLEGMAVDEEKFRVDLTADVFEVSGITRCELVLRGSRGQIISSKTFNVVVDRSIGEEVLK